MQPYWVVILQINEKGEYDKVLKPPYSVLGKNEQSVKDRELLNYAGELWGIKEPLDPERVAILICPFV